MNDSASENKALPPLRSVHTSNFTTFLEQLGISLVVSTYQAGKLIAIRADDGKLNTHFRLFQKPMGLAADQSRLAIGAAYQIWELRNVPAVAEKLEPTGKYDTCYLPRNIHVTGDTAVFSDIPITEQQEERTCGIWVVNVQTKETVAFLKFEDAVQEIFAVQVLPGICFPEIIDFDEELLGSSYVLPDEALAEVAR